jgi:hypothetical protein
MWLSFGFKQQLPQKDVGFFDLLQGLSPDVFVEQRGDRVFAYVSLLGLEKYWGHDGTKLQQKIQFLKKHKPDLECWKAPSFVWCRCLALSGLRNSQESILIDVWTQDRISEEFLKTQPVQVLKYFVDDVMGKATRKDLEFRFFCEALEDFSFSKAFDFLAELQKSRGEFQQRFGSLMNVLFKRVFQDWDDYPRERYTPPKFFEAELDIFWEGSVGSAVDLDGEKSVIDKVKKVFEDWQVRAESRRSAFRQVMVVVKSDRRQNKVYQRLDLAKASRDATNWTRIFEEFWLAQRDRLPGEALKPTLVAEYPDEVSCIELKTSLLEADQESQLNLFNPFEEELSEQWHTLMARMQARVGRGQVLRVGTYAPQASFTPERAVVWRDLDSLEAHSMKVPDGPARPQVLLVAPQPYLKESLNNYDDFLILVDREKALGTLERITNPWNPKGLEDRTYARINNEWIFWNHQDSTNGKAYVHGYFFFKN